jgi:hypothetical protein
MQITEGGRDSGTRWVARRGMVTGMEEATTSRLRCKSFRQRKIAHAHEVLAFVPVHITVVLRFWLSRLTLDLALAWPGRPGGGLRRCTGLRWALALALSRALALALSRGLARLGPARHCRPRGCLTDDAHRELRRPARLADLLARRPVAPLPATDALGARRASHLLVPEDLAVRARRKLLALGPARDAPVARCARVSNTVA